MKTLICDALLFDMDGTLVDSRALVEEVLRAFAHRHGLDADAVIDFAHGMQTRDMVRHYLGDTGLAEAETQAIECYEEQHVQGIVATPGSARILAALPEHAWALVTSAGRVLAGNRMAAAGHRFPAVVVCAEDARPGKPDPTGYLRAARTLGVDPARCVVLEDATAGIQAGLAAGAQVLNVGPYRPRPEPGVFNIGSLEGLQVQQSGNTLEIRFDEIEYEPAR